MNDLAIAVRQLAAYHVQSPALIVRTPEGVYQVSPNGSGEGARNQYVISRNQLGTLMWENGLHREDLANPQMAAKIAALVAAVAETLRTAPRHPLSPGTPALPRHLVGDEGRGTSVPGSGDRRSI